jgi:1-acyl-sn-glycerol-3-phosphate acyltransferase
VAPLPPLSRSAPRQGGAASRAVGRAVLRLLGWWVEGEVPDVPRCVLVGAPHTSNWDFVVGIGAKLALGLRVGWLGKHTIFKRPFAGLLRRLGGIPVDRAAAERIVETAVERFRTEPQLFLGLTPEGTRQRVERWKSGFHRIAVGAGVPILPVRIDWSRRAIVLAPLFFPSGDYERDLAELQAGFSPAMARYPESYTRPQPEGASSPSGTSR